jgi:hypothetical protein
VAAAEPDTVVLRPGSAADHGALSSGGAAQLVYVLRPLPASPTAVAARWVRSADGEAVVQVAAQLSVAGGFDLVLTPSGRPGASLVADLTKRGLAARAGAEPKGAIVIGPADAVSGDPGAPAGRDADLHLAVTAGTNEASDDMDQWVQALDTGQDLAGESDLNATGTESASNDSSRQESRKP